MQRQIEAWTPPGRRGSPSAPYRLSDSTAACLERGKVKHKGVYFQSLHRTSLSWTARWRAHTELPLAETLLRQKLPSLISPSLPSRAPKNSKVEPSGSHTSSHTYFSLSSCTLHFGTCHPLDLSAWQMWLCCEFPFDELLWTERVQASSSPSSTDSHYGLASLIIAKDSFIMGLYNSMPFNTQVKSFFLV